MTVGMIDRAMTPAERQKRWREAHRKQDRSRRTVDDIGPPIWEGDWATDDFERCEQKWSKLLAGVRFEDR